MYIRLKKVNPNINTIIGGIYPTLSPEIVTKDKNIDYFVFGEGEERLPNLLNSIGSEEKLKEIDGVAFRSKNKLVMNPIKSCNKVSIIVLF